MSAGLKDLVPQCESVAHSPETPKIDCILEVQTLNLHEIIFLATLAQENKVRMCLENIQFPCSSSFVFINS